MAETELIIRGWRVTEGQPSGSHVWFDPSTETVKLFRAPPTISAVEPGGALEGVDKGGDLLHLDNDRSVSAQPRERDAVEGQVISPRPNLGEDLPF